jgi:hypothetical protein
MKTDVSPRFAACGVLTFGSTCISKIFSLIGSFPAMHGPCEVASEWPKLKPGQGNALRCIHYGETARGDPRVASRPADDMH